MFNLALGIFTTYLVPKEYGGHGAHGGLTTRAILFYMKNDMVWFILLIVGKFLYSFYCKLFQAIFV